MSNKNARYPILRPISTAQSPSHSNINSHRKSFSKHNTPVVRFKDDPSSTTDLQKVSDTSSPLLSPLLRLEEVDTGIGIIPRPVDISLDPGVDGVFDQALVRLDQLLDRQAQKAHMKKLQLLGGGKSDSQPRASTVSMKNKQIIERVSKYKNIKGITPKTKEYRFEERLAPFKDIKTFIDIRKIVKDMGSPINQPHSGNVSSGTPMIFLPKSKNTPVLEGFNEIYEQMNNDLTPAPSVSAAEKRNSTIFSVKRHSASNEFFTTLQAQLRNVSERESPEVGARNSVMSKAGKESPEISEKVQEAHRKVEEQLKKHMGPKIRDKLGKALQKKHVFERITQRKQASLNIMRETQKNLDDYDAFNTLIGFLSDKDVSKEDDHLDLAKDEGPDTFYTKLEKNVLKHEEKDDEFTEGRISAMLPENEKHDLQDMNNIEIDDEKLTYEMDNLPNNLLEDEQIRIMTTLQAYKKRSDKIISILKKKTKRLQQEVVVKRKAAVVKEKLSSVLKTVPTIKETIEEHDRGGGGLGTIASAIGLRSNSIANKGRASLFRTSIRLRSLDGMADIRKDPSLELPQVGSKLDFELKMKENKKRFIELKQENKKKQFYLTQTDIKKPWVTKSNIQNSNSLNTFYNFGYGPAGSTNGFEEKQQEPSQKSGGQFAKSLKKICGDVSELLTNKSLNTEVKRTIVEREKYFSGKVREITDQEVPEALLIQKKPDFTHKKAKFIMNLTKHLLKER